MLCVLLLTDALQEPFLAAQDDQGESPAVAVVPGVPLASAVDAVPARLGELPAGGRWSAEGSRAAVVPGVLLVSAGDTVPARPAELPAGGRWSAEGSRAVVPGVLLVPVGDAVLAQPGELPAGGGWSAEGSRAAVVPGVPLVPVGDAVLAQPGELPAKPVHGPSPGDPVDVGGTVAFLNPLARALGATPRAPAVEMMELNWSWPSPEGPLPSQVGW